MRCDSALGGEDLVIIWSGIEHGDVDKSFELWEDLSEWYIFEIRVAPRALRWQIRGRMYS
jgi:hypothetical protein